MEPLTGIRRGVIIHGRYRICGKIGSGGFGLIFKAVDISKRNGGKAVAVKINDYALMAPESELESVGSDSAHGTEEKKEAAVPKKDDVCEFLREYTALKHLEKYPGFPRVYAQGVYKGQSYLVVELLGRSLGDIFKEAGYNMTLTNLLLILDQCLMRIKAMHEMGMIHGDIKPDNMMMGVGENEGTLYFIDFGLTSIYWDYKEEKHLEERQRVNQGGTTHFMAIGNHMQISKCRKDDMETLVYVLAYFLRHKKLPWRDYVDFGGNVVAQMKKQAKEDVLFYGYPREFAFFFNDVRNLEYEDQPRYEWYRKIFRRLGVILGIDYETDKPNFPLIN